MKTITLAGGCFWGMEKLYRTLGAEDVTVGYANGDSAQHADYPTVCGGATGFREAVQLRYDPERLPLGQILLAFFAVVDVTVAQRQGGDIGDQYQTGIYWSDEDDREEILRIAEMEKAGAAAFLVELKPLENFYPAEEYHQRYLEKNPGGYCHVSPMEMAKVAAFGYHEGVYDRPAKVLLGEN